MSVLRDLANGRPADEAINREVLRHRCQTQLFCHRSGKLLDHRKAVMVSGKIGTRDAGSHVLDAEEYDKIADQLRAKALEAGMTLEILDGRQLFRDGRRG